jgi:predicted DNA-binding transcriptional regulator YafY
MPANKEALIRYRVINHSLINKQRSFPSLAELIENCEQALGKPVSKRTIQADMEAMRYDEQLGFKAPIIYNSSNRGYSYGDPEYSIDKIPLTSEDIEALEFATKILDQFKAIDLFKPLTGAIEKISQSVKLNRHLYPEQDDYVEVERSPDYEGQEFLLPLAQAIKENRIVKVEYGSFKSKGSKSHVFAPYLLKEYKSRWYVLGYHEIKKMIITFALDRMKKLEETKEFHKKKKRFDSKKYLAYSFGITSSNDSEPEKVELLFDPKQAPYIRSQPIHSSQKILKDNSRGMLISLDVYPSYELISQILSYGSSVRVKKPKSLVKLLKSRIREIEKIYKK